MEKFNLGQKMMFGGIILSVLSLFFTWANAFIIRLNGFEVDGYLFLVVFIYPAIMLIKTKPVAKIGGYICGSIGTFLAVLYIIGSQDELFGNTAGTGAFVFIISCVIFLIGVYKQEVPNVGPKAKEETEKES